MLHTAVRISEVIFDQTEGSLQQLLFTLVGHSPIPISEERFVAQVFGAVSSFACFV